MNHWNEIKTAMQVARLGTLSAAADALGVHRATVLRHVDTLEAALGARLFQRGAQGYVPTDAGEDLMRVAVTADEQFEMLANRARGLSEEISGEFIVTSLEPVADLLLPTLKEFQSRYPQVRVRFLASDKLFKLEYGEAHVAVRTGARPVEPDNVVQPFINQAMGLYAHADYVESRGQPDSIAAMENHAFVGPDELKTLVPHHRWIQDNVPDEAIIFRSNNPQVIKQSILTGTGIGFMFAHEARAIPGIVEVFPPRPEWDVVNWLVTHGDLHRTAKVQAFLKMLKLRVNTRSD